MAAVTEFISVARVLSAGLTARETWLPTPSPSAMEGERVRVPVRPPANAAKVDREALTLFVRERDTLARLWLREGETAIEAEIASTKEASEDRAGETLMTTCWLTPPRAPLRVPETERARLLTALGTEESDPTIDSDEEPVELVAELGEGESVNEPAGVE